MTARSVLFIDHAPALGGAEHSLLIVISGSLIWHALTGLWRSVLLRWAFLYTLRLWSASAALYPHRCLWLQGYEL